METAAELFQKGVEYQERGMIDHAISEYSRALDLEPGNVDVLINLGAAYLQKGMPDKSTQLLTKVLADHPDNALALFNLGKAYLYKEEAAKALTVFERAMAVLPEDLAVRRSLIQSLLLLGRKEEAASLMLGMLEHLVGDANTLLDLGRMLYEQKRYPEALDVYRKAVSAAVDSSAALEGLVRCQIVLDMKDKAITSLKRALMLDPRNPSLHLLMVDLLIGQNEVENAVDHLKRALENDPQQPDLRAKLEELMRKLPALRKRLEAEAIEAKSSLFETDVYDILDGLYDGKVSVEDALEAFAKLRRKDPADMFVAGEMANLLFQARRFNAAADVYNEIYHVMPRDVRARINLAKSVAMGGRVGDARRFLQDSLRDQPMSVDLALALVELDLLERDFKAAWQMLEKPLSENPDNTHCLFLRGYLGVRLNAYDEADRVFKKLLTLTPRDEESAVWFSRLCILRGRPMDASPVWEAFQDGIESLVELVTLVELAMAAGKAAEVKTLLQRIGEIRPNFLEEHILNGKVCLYSGEFNEAVHHFDAALADDPENAEALAAAAMANLARNKVPKFWMCWQRAMESDALYAVLAGLTVCRALNYTQRERLKAETKRMLEISVADQLDKQRVSALLAAL
ncbi:MAG TPA: tetratricopeptide repeat protein [Candidatus Ozemobacteraceae bacterium]|nr:tetratricopeptide repeat protein [Candidatus Ozemobacteraceae bacterium]HQG27653.1 tetratricopeptide repeat protein [Candidatus Ozemobacteraceae bacterium]